MYDIYTVLEGDSASSISQKYNITPYILYQLNGFNKDYILTPGENIVVPKISNTYFEYYTIKKGDNLYKIANKYNVDYKILALINGLDLDDYIYPNQVIAIPKNGVDYYMTREGDTLSTISQKLNTSYDSIINQNNKLFLLPEQLIVYKDKKENM